TAGYGWEVVRNSWGRETPFVKLAPGEPSLAFQGWVTREAGEKLLALAGKTVDELLAASGKRDFRPIPLGIQIRGAMPAKIRELDTRNVAAVVAGSDPKLKDEVVVFSAHWDHLGIGTPVSGDAIYNGAIDNATGCGILLELARAWAALPQKPRRSALFLSVTAEEGGLRGSEYYAAHPLYAPAKTAIDLDYDALDPRRRAHRRLAGGAADRQTAEPGNFLRCAAGAGPLLPFRPLLIRARRNTGLFHRSRHRIPGQAGGLRPEGVGRVQHQALPPALGRIPGGLGFHRGRAGGRVRLRVGNGDRQPGQAPRLAPRR